MTTNPYGIEAENARLKEVAQDRGTPVNTLDFRLVTTKKGVEYVKSKQFVQLTDIDDTPDVEIVEPAEELEITESDGEN